MNKSKIIASKPLEVETITMSPDIPGDIAFHIKTKVMLEIKENGDFLVKGKKVTNDMEVYKAMKEWLDKVKL